MAKTLKDIADQLNLSVSTVSCALKDGPKVVSPEIRDAVRKAALEIGYRPNRIARSLVTGRTHTIGVVPMFVDTDTLLHPYMQLALNGIFNAANELSNDVLVFTARDRNHPHAVADDLLDSRADGVILISPRPDSPAIQRVSVSSLPYAVLFENCGGHSFTIDNRHAVFTALDHLYQYGHRRIATVTGDQNLSDGRSRLEAFRAFMEERRLPILNGYVMAGNFTRVSGYAACSEFLQLTPRPTAICCGNDDIAFGLIDALHGAGVRCPEDVSIIGFDGVTSPMMCNPPLTTLRQPAQLMAAAAVQAVVNCIESGVEIESKVFQPELIVRGSTASVPQGGVN
jgi:LacI family transcriptional regulator/LacI family repressor for deo operon, udp, cdd, tsx, nupC, and nupG